MAVAMSPTIATGEVVKYCAIWLGNSRMLTAKMIGMTPAWLTRSGRNVAALVHAPAAHPARRTGSGSDAGLPGCR